MCPYHCWDDTQDYLLLIYNSYARTSFSILFVSEDTLCYVTKHAKTLSIHICVHTKPLFALCDALSLNNFNGGSRILLSDHTMKMFSAICKKSANFNM